MILKIKKPIDPDILRNLGLREDLKVGDNANIDDEHLKNHAVYDAKTAKEKLGELFEVPDVPEKAPAPVVESPIVVEDDTKKKKKGGGE